MQDIYGFDAQCRGNPARIMAGLDEAGRGPVAGPVVASAVILSPDVRIEGIADSKTIPEKKMRDIFIRVVSHAQAFAVGVADVDEIESLNILGATKLAMRRAIEGLGMEPDVLVIDAVKLEGLDRMEQHSPYKGDSKSASVAAASIIAKYFRDCLMREYHRQYPVYGFDRHKGYGTKQHLSLIREHGPCPIHRIGFRGVMDVPLPF